MPAKTDPQPRRAGSDYYYRRSLSAREIVPALAAAVLAGAAAFYVARILAQRTELLPQRVPARVPEPPRARRSQARVATARTPGG